MDKFFKVTALCFVLFSFPLLQAFSQVQIQDGMLLRGYEAYENEDWATAMFIFRRAITVPSSYAEENWFMLIMSEMFAGEYAAAQEDIDRFMLQFPASTYMSYAMYQKGRAAYHMGDSSTALRVLSDFCHMYPNHTFYPSALFWLAETFNTIGNSDYARALYDRILADFPSDPKTSLAQFRMETIDQRDVQNRLLYLLQVTGEEYQAVRDEARSTQQLPLTDSTAAGTPGASSSGATTTPRPATGTTTAPRPATGTSGTTGTTTTPRPATGTSGTTGTTTTPRPATGTSGTTGTTTTPRPATGTSGTTGTTAPRAGTGNTSSAAGVPPENESPAERRARQAQEQAARVASGENTAGVPLPGETPEETRLRLLEGTAVSSGATTSTGTTTVAVTGPSRSSQ